MAKHHKPYKQNIIWFLMQKSNLNTASLCRQLDCSYVTLVSYIVDPGLIRLRDCTILAGCFGISVETLVYCLNRTLERIPLKAKDKGPHIWYIESKTMEGVKLVEDFEKSLKE